MSWKRYDEPVEMEQRRFCYFPHVFRWRGRRFEIDAVESSWLAPRRPWQRVSDRRFFRICGRDGRFEIYHDLTVGTWHLKRAQLQPAPVLSTILSFG
ncbi:MAG: hypothetical protein JXA93_18900 [Anaerolineae bacterium]|nr:hypothetical protein [Anaerolineae bacterium]